MSDDEDFDEENDQNDYGDESDRELDDYGGDSDMEEEADEDDDRTKRGGEEKEVEFEAERAAYDRTEVRRGFSRKKTMLDSEKGSESWKGRTLQTDEENFADDLDIFYFPNADTINLNTNDFNIIDHLIDIIPHIKCKNPGAFLLAYYAIDTNAKKIIRERLLNERSYRSVMASKEISTEDILRYCRLILKYL